MAGPWIHQATDLPPGKSVIKTGLVAGDTSIDLVFAAFARFFDELRISQHGASHGDEISVALCQHIFGNIGHINTVAGNGGNAQFF